MIPLFWRGVWLLLVYDSCLFIGYRGIQVYQHIIQTILRGPSMADIYASLESYESRIVHVF